MIPETTQAGIEVLSREELSARDYELLNRVRDLEEKLRLERTPTISNNLCLPPSRAFQGEKPRGCRSHKTMGAKRGHRDHVHGRSGIP